MDIKYNKYTRFINSTLSICIAEILTQPICLIRTKLINNNIPTKVDKIISDLIQKEGIFYLFKSSPPAIIVQVISSSIKYNIYIKNYKKSTQEKIRNGIITGIIISTFTNPIDVIRINIQMGIKEFIYKPLPFYYKGYTPSLCKSIIDGAFYFPSKEYLNNQINNDIISKFIASCIVITLSQPVDWIKIRLMNNQVITFQCIKYCYTGYFLNLIKLIPYITITNFLYEY